MQPPTRFVVTIFNVNGHMFLFDFIHVFIHFNNIVTFNASLIEKFLNGALYC